MSTSVGNEHLSMRCYSGDGQAKSHMKNFVVAVLKSLASLVRTPTFQSLMSTRRSCKLCLTASAECMQATKELGNGQGSSCHPNEVGGREHKRYQARRVPVEIVRTRTQTLGPDDARNVPSMGPLELMWKPGASGATTRKILFLDTSRAHCHADATGEMAIELPPEEQVKGEDLITIGRKSSNELSSTVVLSSVHGHQQSCVVESVSCVGLCTEMTSLSLVTRSNWRG